MAISIPAVVRATLQSYGLGKGDELSAEGLKRLAPVALLYATHIDRDADDVELTADITWPDGSAATFARTTKNTGWLAVDAYTVTDAATGLVATVTLTRDASTGAVTDRTVVVTDPGA